MIQKLPVLLAGAAMLVVTIALVVLAAHWVMADSAAGGVCGGG